jgi:hypothetical protein
MVITKLGTCGKCGTYGINVLLGYCVVCGGRVGGEPDYPEIDKETGELVDAGDPDAGDPDGNYDYTYDEV